MAPCLAIPVFATLMILVSIFVSVSATPDWSIYSSADTTRFALTIPPTQTSYTLYMNKWGQLTQNTPNDYHLSTVWYQVQPIDCNYDNSIITITNTTNNTKIVVNSALSAGNIAIDCLLYDGIVSSSRQTLFTLIDDMNSSQQYPYYHQENVQILTTREEFILSPSIPIWHSTTPIVGFGPNLNIKLSYPQLSTFTPSIFIFSNQQDETPLLHVDYTNCTIYTFSSTSGMNFSQVTNWNDYIDRPSFNWTDNAPQSTDLIAYEIHCEFATSAIFKEPDADALNDEDGWLYSLGYTNSTLDDYSLIANTTLHKTMVEGNDFLFLTNTLTFHTIPTPQFITSGAHMAKPFDVEFYKYWDLRPGDQISIGVNPNNPDGVNLLMNDTLFPSLHFWSDVSNYKLQDIGYIISLNQQARWRNILCSLTSEQILFAPDSLTKDIPPIAVWLSRQRSIDGKYDVVQLTNFTQPNLFTFERNFDHYSLFEEAERDDTSFLPPQMHFRIAFTTGDIDHPAMTNFAYNIPDTVPKFDEVSVIISTEHIVPLNLTHFNDDISEAFPLLPTPLYNFSLPEPMASISSNIMSSPFQKDWLEPGKILLFTAQAINPSFRNGFPEGAFTNVTINLKSNGVIVYTFPIEFGPSISYPTVFIRPGQIVRNIPIIGGIDDHVLPSQVISFYIAGAGLWKSISDSVRVIDNNSCFIIDTFTCSSHNDQQLPITIGQYNGKNSFYTPMMSTGIECTGTLKSSLAHAIDSGCSLVGLPYELALTINPEPTSVLIRGSLREDLNLPQKTIFFPLPSWQCASPHKNIAEKIWIDCEDSIFSTCPDGECECEHVRDVKCAYSGALVSSTNGLQDDSVCLVDNNGNNISKPQFIPVHNLFPLLCHVCKDDPHTAYNTGASCNIPPTITNFTIISNTMNYTNTNTTDLNTYDILSYNSNITISFNYTGSEHNIVTIYATSPSLKPFDTIALITIPITSFTQVMNETNNNGISQVILEYTINLSEHINLDQELKDLIFYATIGNVVNTLKSNDNNQDGVVNLFNNTVLLPRCQGIEYHHENETFTITSLCENNSQCNVNTGRCDCDKKSIWQGGDYCEQSICPSLKCADGHTIINSTTNDICFIQEIKNTTTNLITYQPTCNCNIATYTGKQCEISKQCETTISSTFCPIEYGYPMFSLSTKKCGCQCINQYKDAVNIKPTAPRCTECGYKCLNNGVDYSNCSGQCTCSTNDNKSMRYGDLCECAGLLLTSSVSVDDIKLNYIRIKREEITVLVKESKEAQASNDLLSFLQRDTFTSFINTFLQTILLDYRTIIQTSNTTSSLDKKQLDEKLFLYDSKTQQYATNPQSISNLILLKDFGVVQNITSGEKSATFTILIKDYHDQCTTSFNQQDQQHWVTTLTNMASVIDYLKQVGIDVPQDKTNPIEILPPPTKDEEEKKPTNNSGYYSSSTIISIVITFFTIFMVILIN